MVTMKSTIDKQNAINAMADPIGSSEHRTRAGILVALVELREAIEEGFQMFDETFVHGAMMFADCKETLDDFVSDRVNADKVLAGVVAAATMPPKSENEKNQAEAIQNERDRRAAAFAIKDVEDAEKSAEAVDKPKKSAVTLDVGDFGGPKRESGIV